MERNLRQNIAARLGRSQVTEMAPPREPVNVTNSSLTPADAETATVMALSINRSNMPGR